MFLSRKQRIFRFFHRLAFAITVMTTTAAFYTLMFLIFIVVN